MIQMVKSLIYTNQESLSDQEEGDDTQNILSLGPGLPNVRPPLPPTSGLQSKSFPPWNLGRPGSGPNRFSGVADNATKLIDSGRGLTQAEIAQLESALQVITLLSEKSEAANRATCSRPASRLRGGLCVDLSDSENEFENPFGDAPCDLPARSTDIFGRDPYQRSSAPRDLYSRVKVPKWPIRFSGDGKGMNLNDFLAEIQILSINEEVGEKEMLRNIYHLLVGSARTWYRANWQGFKKWSNLVEALRREFLPTDHDYWLAREVDCRMQGKNESFGVYVASMELLFQNFLDPVSDSKQLKTIMRNMRPFYLEKLSLIDVRCLDELKAQCKRIDDVKYNLDRRFGRTGGSTESSSSVRSRLSALETADDDETDSKVEEDEVCECQLNEIRTSHNNQGNKRGNGSKPKKQSQEKAPAQKNDGNKPSSPAKSSNEANPGPGVINTTESTEGGDKSTRKKFVITCWNCCQEGHHFNFCRERTKRIFCFKCGKEGEYSPSCTKCLTKSEN